MPGRAYRRLLYNATPFSYKKGYINKTNNYICNFNNINNSIFTSNGKKILQNIEFNIDKLIDTITLKLDCDTIIPITNNLDETIKNHELNEIMKSKSQTLELLNKIETILQDKYNNVNMSELDTIYSHITYVRESITHLEPSCCLSYENNIKNKIIEIISIFSKLINTDSIYSNIYNLYYTIRTNNNNLKYIKEAEDLLLSIIQNISDNVSVGIILCRIDGLNELINKIDESCIFYNTTYSNEIFEIITLLSSTNLFSDNIIDSVCKKIEGLHSDISKKIQCMEIVQEAEDLLLNIIQNITDKVDFNIILCRIEYFKEILIKIKSL
jgi:hypothetical protein